MIDQIICGDCLEELPAIPEDSIDAIVTDPPYELAFMGKKWDGTGIAYNRDMWAGCLRVLKPGGHLLAFGGTRTYHRMACAIEDAGFEIRDCLEWVYGSGFPKSLDISKAIDKHGGQSVSWFGSWLRRWREENGITQKDIATLFPSKTGNLTGCVANWELNLNMPTCEQFNLICKTFNLPFKSLEEAEREIIGKNPNGFGPNKGVSLTHNLAAHPDITAPATPAAKQWSGWGSALKPAHEPIVLARKPLEENTVAENVLRWRCGGLNINKCRIESSKSCPRLRGVNAGLNGEFLKGKKDVSRFGNDSGRFPSNLIWSHSPNCDPALCDSSCPTWEFAKAGDRKVGFFNGHRNKPKTKNDFGLFKLQDEAPAHVASSGSAARFFKSCQFTEEDLPTFMYCAKASPSERNGSTHPTVKPLSLMRYLCRLITPPCGIVLDPFAGSGTTCLAAKLEGFGYIGIEKEAEYHEIARKRIAAVPARLDRWVEGTP